MTAVELAVRFWGTEDATAVLHEWGGFHLVATEDGTYGFCKQALGLIGALSPKAGVLSLEEGVLSPNEGVLLLEDGALPPKDAGLIGVLSLAEETGSSEEGFGSVLTFSASWASQAFAAHNIFLSFSEDLPIVDNEDSSTLHKRPIIYIQAMLLMR